MSTPAYKDFHGVTVSKGNRVIAAYGPGLLQEATIKSLQRDGRVLVSLGNLESMAEFWPTGCVRIP
jgi:hypothetical protein